MPTVKKKTAKTLKDDLSEIASQAVIDGKVIEMLQRVVSPPKGAKYTLGTDRNGKLIKGHPPIRDRITAGKLLLEYAVGKPKTVKDEPPPTAAVKKRIEKTSPEIISEVLTQMERMARIAGHTQPEQGDDHVEEGVAEVVDVHQGDGREPPPALPAGVPE